jgi:hypothetical protein
MQGAGKPPNVCGGKHFEDAPASSVHATLVCIVPITSSGHAMLLLSVSSSYCCLLLSDKARAK